MSEHCQSMTERLRERRGCGVAGSQAGRRKAKRSGIFAVVSIWM